MMNLQEELVDDLWDHCFGAGDPTPLLLNSGKFPKNWVSKYLSFLEEVSAQWAGAAAWPPRVVTAIHSTSFYLNPRYDVWKHTGGRNEQTEKLLGQLRTPSELFLLKPHTDWFSNQHGDATAEEGREGGEPPK